MLCVGWWRRAIVEWDIGEKEQSRLILMIKHELSQANRFILATKFRIFAIVFNIHNLIGDISWRLSFRLAALVSLRKALRQAVEGT